MAEIATWWLGIEETAASSRFGSRVAFEYVVLDEEIKVQFFFGEKHSKIVTFI